MDKNNGDIEGDDENIKKHPVSQRVLMYVSFYYNIYLPVYSTRIVSMRLHASDAVFCFDCCMFCWRVVVRTAHVCCFLNPLI